MITVETLTLPAAGLGAPNPLPDIKNNTYIHAAIGTTENITPEEAKNIGRGMIPTLLPYLVQDGYDRDKRPRSFTLVVLENDHLRAEFLPQLGARLRRLYDKHTGEELLNVNPVFQPCNLALRNAWFSGGVEFNVGIKGHNPLTCSPVFAEKRTDADGNEYVSFYEYERIRGLVWSVNAYLPPDARALTLRCVVENPADKPQYMYWWSNIAVDEADGTRVIVPTDETFINYFGDDSYVLDKGPYPHVFDRDASYPENMDRSIDFFYKIPPCRRKWIAAATKEGRGLLHYSDDTLFGRKLFLWGRGQGGRHWGEYLSGPDVPNYIEIQAGLAHTQLEHFIMDANSRLEWVECYAPLDCRPQDVHGDWHTAIDAVETYLDSIAGDTFAAAPALTPAAALQKREMLHRGSGWGALEQQAQGKNFSTFFDDWASEDPATAPFTRLLRGGYLPETQPLTPPTGYVTGRHWAEKITASLQHPQGAHWAAYLQLGVTLYELGCKGDAGAMADCVAMWQRSAQCCPNPWALRNLAAFYAGEQGDLRTACSYAVQALAMKPDDRSLAIDCGQLLLRAGKNSQWLELCDTLAPAVAGTGRIRLMQAKALLALDKLQEAATIVNADFEMPDIKEGEVSISALWFELKARQDGITVDEAKAKYALPYSLDFRMH